MKGKVRGKVADKVAGDSCWKVAWKYRELGTVGMIQKCYEQGFSRQTLANVFGVAFVLKALGKKEGEQLIEPSWS